MPQTKLLCKTALIVFTLLVCGLSQATDDHVRVVPESSLSLWWQPDPVTPNQAPKYPLEALQANVEGCVVVAFEIHGDGSVSNERLWRSVFTNVRSDKRIEQASLLALHQWRFIPAVANKGRSSVYTYHIFTYVVSGPQWTANDERRDRELKSKCEISDFAQQVQNMTDAASRAKGGKP